MILLPKEAVMIVKVTYIKTLAEVSPCEASASAATTTILEYGLQSVFTILKYTHFYLISSSLH